MGGAGVMVDAAYRGFTAIPASGTGGIGGPAEAAVYEVLAFTMRHRK